MGHLSVLFECSSGKVCLGWGAMPCLLSDPNTDSHASAQAMCRYTPHSAITINVSAGLTKVTKTLLACQWFVPRHLTINRKHLSQNRKCYSLIGPCVIQWEPSFSQWESSYFKGYKRREHTHCIQSFQVVPLQISRLMYCFSIACV